MGEKCQQRDRFPSLTLNLIGVATITLPDKADNRHVALLFYRGH